MKSAPPFAGTGSTMRANAFVDGLDRGDRGIEHAGVTDHVRVREVDER